LLLLAQRDAQSRPRSILAKQTEGILFRGTFVTRARRGRELHFSGTCWAVSRV